VFCYWRQGVTPRLLDLFYPSQIYPSLALRPLGISQSSHPYPPAAGWARRRRWPASPGQQMARGPLVAHLEAIWRGWPVRRRLRRGCTAVADGGGRGRRWFWRGRRSACPQANAMAHLRVREGTGCVGQRWKARETGARSRGGNGGRL
jgi:hypothetical protein